QLEPAVDEMRVPVSEARQHETAARPNHTGARADVSGHGPRVADGQDFAVADGHGTRLGSAAGKTGPHHASLNHDVGRAGAGGGLGGSVGLAISRLEIPEDALARTWTHGRERYSFAT